MMEDVRWRMEFVLQFVQDVDIERYYFSKAKILSPAQAFACGNESEGCGDVE
jgi:hypothetical protein